MAGKPPRSSRTAERSDARRPGVGNCPHSYPAVALYLAPQRALVVADALRRTPVGGVRQPDDPGNAWLDFLFGAAGTGHFFLRLWRPDQLTRPLP